MKINLILPIVFISLILTGCNLLKTQGPHYMSVKQPESDANTALIYIYRVNNIVGYKGSMSVTINDKHEFDLSDSTFSYFKLQPGIYSLKTEWSFMDKPLFEEGHFDPKSKEFTFESGKTYYINYSIKRNNEPDSILAQQSLLGKSLSKSNILSASLELEPESLASKNLRSCYLFDAKVN